MKRVGIKDVAREAGVSTSTVSLVLSGKTEARIPAGTRERVHRVAAEIGYAPNSIARGLRTRRTHTIGLVSDQIATTPHAVRMIEAVQDVAREQGRLLFLVNTGVRPRRRADRGRDAPGPPGRRLVYACMWHQVVDATGRPPGGLGLPRLPPRLGRASRPSSRTTAAVPSRPSASSSPRATAGSPTSPRTSTRAHRLRPALGGLRGGAARGRHRARPARCASAVTTHDRRRRRRGGRGTCSTCRRTCARRRCSASTTAWRWGPTARRAGAGWRSPRTCRSIGYDDQQLIAAALDPPLTTVALPHYAMGRWAMEVALGPPRTPGRGRRGCAHAVPDRPPGIGWPAAGRSSTSRPAAGTDTPHSGRRETPTTGRPDLPVGSPGEEATMKRRSSLTMLAAVAPSATAARRRAARPVSPAAATRATAARPS